MKAACASRNMWAVLPELDARPKVPENFPGLFLRVFPGREGKSGFCGLYIVYVNFWMRFI